MIKPMRFFRLTISLADGTVAMVMGDRPRAGSRPSSEVVSAAADVPEMARIYSAEEQYPLAASRYAVNLANIFIDVCDAIDHDYADCGIGLEAEETAANNPSISLHTLTLRARRAVTNGSGQVDARFHDAQSLWEKLCAHVVRHAVQVEAEPILDVRKSHNWRKNQPMAEVIADPQAWYVTDMFNRSNIKKDAIHIYHGLGAVLDHIATDESEAWRKAATQDLCLPQYRSVSELLDDSNMLVFHNNESLRAWLSEQSAAKSGQAVLDPNTPVILHRATTSVGAHAIVGDRHEGEPEALAELKDGDSAGAANFAKRLVA